MFSTTLFYYYCKLTIIRNNLISWYASDKMILILWPSLSTQCADSLAQMQHLYQYI